MGDAISFRVEDDGEIQLFGAIVREAIVEAIKGRAAGVFCSVPKRERQAAQSRRWFFSEQFETLCGIFDADARTVRPAALEVIDRNRAAPTRQIRWSDQPRTQKSRAAHDRGTCDGCGRDFAQIRSHRKHCTAGEWEFLG